MLAATALFGAFGTLVESALTGKAAGTFSLDVTGRTSWSASSSARSVVFLFASLLIRAVGRAAQRVVLEVRNQFRTHPGIMDLRARSPTTAGWSTSSPGTRCAS